ncbi:sterol desaturase family protein [Mesorhizobium sp. M7A.F.Ca.US.006.01.1.1]|uniref:sterol desaturase family protein n=1 Tax=Mesorhizobium sp. M7A.F.Ca.US.006.01.1.1 TaxID=2496707 RepID=UPI000FCB0698|nr:sterol desaturase family protein [Mesorhizobium sp. M7A.F.Ca.US.006.01.1.1]RUZ79187.1 sterol desaturase family protein [Mesorhizobium sp. M7A.F.Ca.US.006.01.1.1]
MMYKRAVMLEAWARDIIFVIAVGALCAPTEIMLGSRRSWLGSRLRGILFWMPFALSTLAGAALVHSGSQYFKIQPLFEVIFTGENIGQVARIAIAGTLALGSGFLFDFVYYWYHRAQHAFPPLWQFHAVHHSIEDLNATNCSHHWLEGFFKAFAVTVPLSLLIKLGYPEVVFISAVFSTWGQFVHADSRVGFGPLRWLIVSPVFHRVHHSTDRRHFDKNFAGQFAIIDVLFGTAVFPGSGETITTGLSDKHEPKTLSEQMIRLRPRV